MLTVSVSMHDYEMCAVDSGTSLRLEEMCSNLNVTGLEVIKRKLNVSYYCA